MSDRASSAARKSPRGATRRPGATSPGRSTTKLRPNPRPPTMVTSLSKPTSAKLAPAISSPSGSTRKATTAGAEPLSVSAKAIPAATRPTALPRQRSSAVLNFTRGVRKDLADSIKVSKSASTKSSNTSSDDSWRAWPSGACRRPFGAPVPPKCRRTASCDSSDSSNLSLKDSDRGDQSNTNLSSQENFNAWLRSRTVTVILDPSVSNRSWSVSKLIFKKLAPEKCTVRDLRLGLEFVTGIPSDMTYLFFSGEEMRDRDSLEKAALNGGATTLGIYSIWQDFIRILFTGNCKNIVEAITLHDPNTAPVYADIFNVMIAHDGNTRKEVSATDILRQAPSDLDVKTREDLETTTATTQKSMKLPVYTVVKERNLVTQQMREDMVTKRMYAALLFATVNRHKQLQEWILSRADFNPNYRYPSGRNLIFLAVFFRSMARLKELVAAKVDWQTADVTGLTPAALAARTHDEELKTLFEELEDALDEADGKKKKKRGKSGKHKKTGKSKSVKRKGP